ncbi:MAG: alkaline phosphatase D [Candidatus Azotimanducaceae bacterium]|jgi:alkaline phosphatase D
MNKSWILLSAVALALLFVQVSEAETTDTTHILFGSCSHQDKPMPIFNAILSEPKDAFVFLGDNIYGDTENMEELAKKYKQLGANPLIKKLRETTPTYAIWDDHDYGENDGGKNYSQKEASKKLLLDFWDVPQDSPRRTREDGLYGSYVVGQGAHQIRIILPDLRYQRDDLTSVGTFDYFANRRPNNMGPYSKSVGSMLGAQQWQWLALELQKPEPIKIVASSLQVLSDFTGWEAWGNFDDKQRLFDLIKKHRINGVMLISGDTHWGEISKLEDGLDYPLWDVTSSGLTEEWKNVSPNKNRVSEATTDVNYGFVSVNWAKEDPSIQFGLKDVEGKLVVSKSINLSDISTY